MTKRYLVNRQPDGRWFVIDTKVREIIRIWNWDQAEEASLHAETLNGGRHA